MSCKDVFRAAAVCFHCTGRLGETLCLSRRLKQLLGFNNHDELTMENFLLSQQHDSLKHVFILKYSAAHDGRYEWKCRKKCSTNKGGWVCTDHGKVWPGCNLSITRNATPHCISTQERAKKFGLCQNNKHKISTGPSSACTLTLSLIQGCCSERIRAL